MVRVRKTLYAYFVFILAFLTLPSTMALAARTRVTGIRFSSPPLVGDKSVHLVGTALSDVGLSVSQVNFSVLGVSAQDLIQVSGLDSAIPSSELLKNGVDTLLTNGLYFLHTSDLSGTALENGEFSLDLPISQGVPDDAIFMVTATAIDEEGDTSIPFTKVLRLKSQGPLVVEFLVSLFIAPEGNSLVIDGWLPEESKITRARVNLYGTSAARLVRAGGNPEKVEKFITVTDFTVYSQVEDGLKKFNATFSLSKDKALPQDGVVILSVTCFDTSHNSKTFTDVYLFEDIIQESLDNIEVRPSSIALTGFGQTMQLKVTGLLSSGGRTDLTGSSRGTTYQVDQPGIISVTGEGLITALSSGTATVTVTNQKFSQEVSVMVGEELALISLIVGPEGLFLDGMGATDFLVVTGKVTGDIPIDITLGRTGTRYESSDPSVIEVSEDGQILGKAIGKAVIKVTNVNSETLFDIMEIEVRDGPPSIYLLSNKPGIPEGETFTVTAMVTDDLGPEGIAEVMFLVDGDSVGSLREPPFQLQLQAPERGAGLTLMITGLVSDVNGNETISSALPIRILSPPDTSPPTMEMVSPAMEETVYLDFMPSSHRSVEGSKVILAVNGTPDTQRIEFFFDGTSVGNDYSGRPIHTEITNPQGKKEIKVAYENVFEVEYIAPEVSSSGRNFAITAKAMDSAGNEGYCPGTTIHIIDDAPPKITISSPRNEAGLPEGEDFAITADAFDDLLTTGVTIKVYFGEDVLFTENEVIYSVTQRSEAEIIHGSQTSFGSTTVKVTHTLPEACVGKSFYIMAEITDKKKQTSRSDIIRIKAIQEQTPQVYLLSPMPSSEIIAGTTVMVKAKAIDDRGIATVEFFIDGTRYITDGTHPYEFPYLVPIARAGQSMTLKAIARDISGLVTPEEDAAVVTVAIVRDDSPPTILIAKPNEAETFTTTQDIMISASGRDDVGVDKIEISVNGVVVYVNDQPGVVSDLIHSSFVSFVYPSARTGAGDTLTIGAAAYDPTGNKSEAEPVRIRILEDNRPQITAMTSSVGIAGKLTIRNQCDVLIEAEDDVQVREVTLSVNGQALSPDTKSPFQFRLTAPDHPTTLHLTARAIDTAGQESDPAGLDIEVVADTVAPNISITNPRKDDQIRAGTRHPYQCLSHR